MFRGESGREIRREDGERGGGEDEVKLVGKALSSSTGIGGNS